MKQRIVKVPSAASRKHFSGGDSAAKTRRGALAPEDDVLYGERTGEINNTAARAQIVFRGIEAR